jgi:hypothetical protein
MTTLEATLALTQQDKRVCPMPQAWQRLYKLLPNTHRVGNGWEPPLPLILAAWDFSSDLDKRARLQEHLRWADAHQALPAVHQFLSDLQPDQWHCAD